MPKTTAQTHTPGPWRVVSAGSGLKAQPALIVAKYLRITVDRREDFGDPLPDARLIAAAPDLLEALSIVQERLLKTIPWLTIEPNVIEIKEQIKIARAAIARAEERK